MINLEKKRWVVNKTDYYEEYSKKHTTLNKDKFEKLVSDIFLKIENYILDGFIFEFGGIGSFGLYRIEVNFEKPRLNWKESYKLRDEIVANGGIPKSEEHPNGEPWFVYYTQDHYYLVLWDKRRSTYVGKYVYKFKLSTKSRLYKEIVKNQFTFDFDSRFIKIPHLKELRQIALKTKSNNLYA